MKENRLYRIVNGRVIGGVAGGLAEFFGIDPTIIRIIFILLTIMGGGGILIYIILWIVVPERYITQSPYSTYSPPINSDSSSGSGVGETYKGYDPVSATGQPEIIKKNSKMEGSLIAGLVLILIGGFFLFERYMPNIDFGDFWPLLLILIGILMIIKGIPGVISKKEEPISNEKENITNNDLNL